MVRKSVSQPEALRDKILKEEKMGKSYTYHVIGCAPLPKNKEQLFCAMNKLEMAQQREKAKRQGLKIAYWYAQTGTGKRILKGNWEISDSEIEVKNTVTCAICGGLGHSNPKGKKVRVINFWCVVCDGSGVTRKDQYSRWQNWQLKDMVENRRRI